jgi:hypothetical protein
MGTDKTVFVVVIHGCGAIKSHVNRRGHVRKYAHAQPEFVEYQPEWGLFTGNDVSHLTSGYVSGRAPDRNRISRK